MCCVRGRQAQLMCTDPAGPAPRCKHCAGSSACSRAPRNVSAPRAASCPDNIRLTFSCHSSIPDTLNILFTSESLFHIHGQLSTSSATTNFYAVFFLQGENILSLTWCIYKAGCAAKQICSFTTPSNVGIKSFLSVKSKNGFHSTNINYKLWTWQHISIVIFTTNVILIDIVIIKRKKKTQPPKLLQVQQTFISLQILPRLLFAQP